MDLKLMPIVVLEGNYPNTGSEPAFLALSDHSRGDIDLSYDNYEKSVQLANGQTRKYVVSTKRKLSVSWSNLPSVAAATVDLFAGGRDLERFYQNNYNNEIKIYVYVDRGSGTLPATGMLKSGNGVIGTLPENYGQAIVFTGYIDSFSYNVVKRHYGNGTTTGGYYDLWDVSLSITEA